MSKFKMGTIAILALSFGSHASVKMLGENSEYIFLEVQDTYKMGDSDTKKTAKAGAIKSVLEKSAMHIGGFVRTTTTLRGEDVKIDSVQVISTAYMEIADIESTFQATQSGDFIVKSIADVKVNKQKMNALFREIFTAEDAEMEIARLKRENAVLQEKLLPKKPSARWETFLGFQPPHKQYKFDGKGLANDIKERQKSNKYQEDLLKKDIEDFLVKFTSAYQFEYTSTDVHNSLEGKALFDLFVNVKYGSGGKARSFGEELDKILHRKPYNRNKTKQPFYYKYYEGDFDLAIKHSFMKGDDELSQFAFDYLSRFKVEIAVTLNGKMRDERLVLGLRGYKSDSGTIYSPFIELVEKPEKWIAFRFAGLDEKQVKSIKGIAIEIIVTKDGRRIS